MSGSVNEVFAALCLTLAYRRWPEASAPIGALIPGAGFKYSHRFGSVRRTGRIVEVIRPVGITLKEVLYDPPCRVGLTLRWRVDSTGAGSAARMRLEYRLNHAAQLRARHWDKRLSAHILRQFRYLARNIEAARICEVSLTIPKQTVT